MTRGVGSRSFVLALVALLTTSLVAAPTAQAQFGGLIKRAVAGKAVEKVTDKVGPKAPPARGAFGPTLSATLSAAFPATARLMSPPNCACAVGATTSMAISAGTTARVPSPRVMTLPQM